jgi:hypothetical protein
MKDKVKKYLTNDEEKQLWEELYNAFQEKGEKGLKEVIIKHKQEIEKEFKKFKEKIENRLEGKHED